MATFVLFIILLLLIFQVADLRSKVNRLMRERPENTNVVVTLKSGPDADLTKQVLTERMRFGVEPKHRPSDYRDNL